MKASSFAAGGLAALVIISLHWAQPQQPAAHQPSTGLILLGRVVWPGLETYPAGAVTIARDRKFAQVVQTVPIARDGRFVAIVDPGNYYLRAVVDLDSNGKLSEGDGLGFYGSKSPDTPPARLDMSPEAEAKPAVIPVIFQFGPALKLKPARTGPRAVLGCVQGRCQPPDSPAYVMLWPAHAAAWCGYATRVGQEGTIRVRAPAGSYVVLAVVDADADGVVEAGEPSTWVRADQGTPARISVRAGHSRQIDLPERWQPWDPNGFSKRAAFLSSPKLPWMTPAVLDLRVPTSAPLAMRRLLMFADRQMTTLVRAIWLAPDTLLAVRPATYYVMCGIDVDDSGFLGRGDSLAFTAKAAEPAPLQVSVRPGEVAALLFDKLTRLTDAMLQSIGKGSDSAEH